MDRDNASYNGLSGINLTNSNWNSVLDNVANHNTENGIVLASSSNNTVFNNTARWNDQDGILLTEGSDGNNVTRTRSAVTGGTGSRSTGRAGTSS